MRSGRRPISVILSVLFTVTLAAPAFAATPASGQLTDAQRTVTYAGGPFVLPNRTDPLLGDGSTLVCAPTTCDEFALSVALPADFLRTHPDASVKIELKANNGTSDYDLYVKDASGAYVAIGYNAGGTESVEFAALNGTTSYTVYAVPFSANAAAFTATVALLASDPTTDTDGDGVVDVLDACPGTPAGATVNAQGCAANQVVIPSNPDQPRVVVADLDSAINPYHEF